MASESLHDLLARRQRDVELLHRLEASYSGGDLQIMEVRERVLVDTREERIERQKERIYLADTRIAQLRAQAGSKQLA